MRIQCHRCGNIRKFTRCSRLRLAQDILITYSRKEVKVGSKKDEDGGMPDAWYCGRCHEPVSDANYERLEALCNLTNPLLPQWNRKFAINLHRKAGLE